MNDRLGWVFVSSLFQQTDADRGGARTRTEAGLARAHLEIWLNSGQKETQEKQLTLLESHRHPSPLEVSRESKDSSASGCWLSWAYRLSVGLTIGHFLFPPDLFTKSPTCTPCSLLSSPP